MFAFLPATRQMLRRADAGDDVLALRVDEILAVEFGHAGRGIAREGDAGRAIIAHIAEDHRLDVDCGAPIRRDLMKPAIGDRALVHPRAEDRADRAPELLLRVLRERLAERALDQRLVIGDDVMPILGLQLRVEIDAAVELLRLDHILEMVMLDAEHDLAVHLDEAAIAVIGKALVAARLGEALDRLIVEAEIEHRIHHARHRGARARAHRDEQRIGGIAELPSDRLLDLGQRGGAQRFRSFG